MCDCQRSCDRPRRRGGLLGALVQLVIVWIVLVFGSGTLMHTGHPVAVEAGRLIRTVTFVEPAMYWADTRGHETLGRGLARLADGIDVSKVDVALGG